MSYLNFKSEGISVSVDATREEKVAIDVGTMPQVARELLLKGMVAVANLEDSELRVDLADHFTLFFKQRPEISRMLVAHPEKDQWVGTLALTETHYQVLIQAMSQLQSQTLIQTLILKPEAEGEEAVLVQSLGKVDRSSNLLLRFR